MRLFFCAAVFLAAALLFLVQPLAAKLVLPTLGGSPAVWNTVMLFFQTLLLGAYLYAHLLTTRLRPTAQGLVHAATLGLGALMLPIALRPAWAPGAPGETLGVTPWLLLILTGMCALPFFAIATTGPLLQKWYSRTDAPDARDPYFLYAASNIGSFVGLLCFPFLLEPTLTLQEQSRGWTIGYFVFLPLVLSCFVFSLRRAGDKAVRASAATAGAAASGERRWSDILLWIALAAVPSSLSLGVTQTVTTDLAPVPLLWVIPLAIYLLTFVIAFSSRFALRSSLSGSLLPLAVLFLLFTRLSGVQIPVELAVGSHLAMFFLAALMCHTRLSETRPPPERLTEFYLWIAVGGVLGGAVNSLLAPNFFNAAIEYPLAIAAACALIPARRGTGERRTALVSVLVTLLVVSATIVLVERFVAGGAEQRALVRSIALMIVCGAVLLGPAGGPARFGLATLIALASGIFFSRQVAGTLIYVERTFFGIHEVYANGHAHVLQHGSTIHGIQDRREEFANIPLTYYAAQGPLGDIIRTAQDRSAGPLRIAAVGLGTGTVATYVRPDDHLTFFEIDPSVVAIATNAELFSFIEQSKGKIDFRLGDGRAALARERDRFDLIILDAFSSDAIPTHLLTKEAFGVYQSRLKPGGLIAVHVSNRYLDLAPIVAASADPLGLSSGVRDDMLSQEESRRAARHPSEWAVVGEETAIAPVLTRPGWARLTPSRTRAWTDSYSSILRAIKTE